MKTSIEVKDRKAQVVVLGTLLSLPTDRARTRVLTFVKDKLDEDGAK